MFVCVCVCVFEFESMKCNLFCGGKFDHGKSSKQTYKVHLSISFEMAHFLFFFLPVPAELLLDGLAAEAALLAAAAAAATC